MCGGERISNHTSNSDSHHGCSCAPMAGVLPAQSNFLLKGLIFAVGCCILPCAQGNNVELYRSPAAFRGATDILGQQLTANANLLSNNFDLWSSNDYEHEESGVLASEPADALVAFDRGNQWPLLNQLPIQRQLHAEGEEEEGEEETHLTKEKAWTVVGAVLVILAVSLFGVFLPTIVKRVFGGNGHHVVGLVLESLCTAFAAGGFWGLALIHVLLEAITSLENLGYGLHLGPSYMNAAFPLACAGYAFMLGVESFAKVMSKKTFNKQREQQTAYGGQQKLAIIDASIACLALTVHSVFEGMVIGMRDSTLLVWIACISVSGHKWAAAFALAQRMSAHATPKAIRAIFLSIFVLSTPVGAFIGLPLSTMEDLPVVGILNALSAGVLIYVASECTADVFGGTHVHVPNTEAVRDVEISGSEVLLKNGDVETHGSHRHSESDLEACIPLFLGRFVALIAGMALVFGMMCLHMKNPGHSHSHSH